MDRPAAPDAAHEAAAAIAEAFLGWRRGFRMLSRAARRHFEHGDWHATQRDSSRRLDLYNDHVVGALDGVRDLLGARFGHRGTWTEIRAAFDARVGERPDDRLAETFFNSVVRRVFHTVGVAPDVEFVAPKSAPVEHRAPWSHTRVHVIGDALADAFHDVLLGAGLEAAWDDAARDAERLAEAARPHLAPGTATAIEVVRAPFFRGKAAYLVGQVHIVGGSIPLVVALLNPEGRIVVDAALFTEDDVSVVFSFARSYFFVEADDPHELVDYLRSLMPRKPAAELWNSLGFHRHGKTELFRSLLEHLRSTDEKFVVAPGKRGMVMAVFVLPGFDVVFKVIRDRFEFPKTVTHAQVREKYDIVYRHDRAGRLVDAQRFEHLEFPADRFDPELLDELLTSTSETVRREGDRIVIAHLYTERRLVPLDVYLESAPIEAAKLAVADYGQALKDLAATNIFPGDMLLKNFGVTRHGRTVFYDYDELCLLTECRFRDLPVARGGDEEVAAEPWYFVDERDVFPEEFRTFLGLRGELLAAFLSAHGDLLTAEFWRRMQDRVRRGEVIEIFPYRRSSRLRPGAA